MSNVQRFNERLRQLKQGFITPLSYSLLDVINDIEVEIKKEWLIPYFIPELAGIIHEYLDYRNYDKLLLYSVPLHAFHIMNKEYHCYLDNLVFFGRTDGGSFHINFSAGKGDVEHERVSGHFPLALDELHCEVLEIQCDNPDEQFLVGVPSNSTRFELDYPCVAEDEDDWTNGDREACGIDVWHDEVVFTWDETSSEIIDPRTQSHHFANNCPIFAMNDGYLRTVLSRPHG